MQRERLALSLGALCALAAMGACGLDESGTASDGGPDVATVDVTTDVRDGGGTDGPSADASDAADVQLQDVFIPGCDGGTTCVANIPGGYTIVEYDPTAQPGCTAGYNAQVNLIENPQPATNTCACTCMSTPNPLPTCKCGGNTAAFDIFTGSNCPGATSPSEILADLNCYTTTQSLNGNNDAIIAKPDAGCTASGGNCGSATAKGTFTVSEQQGRRCDLATSNTPVCADNGICVPTPTTGWGLCITDGTMKACPPTWTNFPHVVGTGVSDTRVCTCPGTCNVNTGTCSTPKLTLYTASNCTGANGNVTADGTTCTTGFGTNPSWGSAKYSTTNSGASCAYSSGSGVINGSVALDTSQYQICCQ